MKKLIAVTTLLIFVSPINSLATIVHVPSEYLTIQEGIDAASDGDTVLVAPGIYSGIGNGGIYFNGKSLLLKAETGPDDTIVDGQWDYYWTGFHFEDYETSSTVLDGFTITQFFNGVSIWESSPIIRNCNIYFCGDYMFNPCSGIYMYESAAQVIDCTISACFSQDDSPAIYAPNSNPLIIGSLFYWNIGETNLGTIYCGGNSLLVNCTIVDNESWYALYGNATIINTIIRDNYGVFNGSPEVRYSDIEGGWPGEGNIDADPLFIDPLNGDYHLSGDSPCIDAGDPDSQNVRWGGWRRDMGAFEFDQGFYFDGQNLIYKPFPIEIPTLLQ